MEQRFYLIDYPEGYYYQCQKIAFSSYRFIMYGETTDTPTYEGANKVHVIPNKAERHQKILETLYTLTNSRSSRDLRISLYTRDPDLMRQAQEQFTPDLKKNVAFFGVFEIR